MVREQASEVSILEQKSAPEISASLKPETAPAAAKMPFVIRPISLLFIRALMRREKRFSPDRNGSQETLDAMVLQGHVSGRAGGGKHTGQ